MYVRCEESATLRPEATYLPRDGYGADPRDSVS